jgi:hypothetical protein
MEERKKMKTKDTLRFAHTNHHYTADKLFEKSQDTAMTHANTLRILQARLSVKNEEEKP